MKEHVLLQLLQCCSSQKAFPHTRKILLYLYINIEFIFDVGRSYFGTATLQQRNAAKLGYAEKKSCKNS